MKIASCVIHGILALTGTLAVVTAPAQGYDGPWPLVFDWTVSPEWGAVNPTPISTQTLPSGFHANLDAITPLPKPSYYAMMKEDPRFVTLFQQLEAQNRPKGFLLGSDTSPLYGLRDPGTLSYMLNQFHTSNRKLDFVFVEYEPQFAADKVQETNATVTAIRSHSNPLINQAKIGEYDIYPTSNMRFQWYPAANTQERIDQMNGLYNSAGLNVAMPSLYPNEAYELHTSSAYWPVSQRSPNERSALFYGPLELFSNVKMNMPAGHWLIPYVSDFLHMDGFDAAPPPREDNAAFIKHLRLRGADGYYGYYVNQNYGAESAAKNEEFKSDAANSWTGLDWLFEGAGGDPRILNLSTNKRFGIEWSGVATDNGVAIIITNLGNTATTFTVPSITGHPEYDALLPDTVQLPAGTHQLIFAQVPEPAMGLLAMVGIPLAVRRRT